MDCSDFYDVCVIIHRVSTRSAPKQIPCMFIHFRGTGVQSMSLVDDWFLRGSGWCMLLSLVSHSTFPFLLYLLQRTCWWFAHGFQTIVHHLHTRLRKNVLVRSFNGLLLLWSVQFSFNIILNTAVWNCMGCCARHILPDPPCVFFQENRPNKAIAADSESGPVAWTDRLHSFLRQPRNASKTKAHKCRMITAFCIQNLGVSEDWQCVAWGTSSSHNPGHYFSGQCISMKYFANARFLSPSVAFWIFLPHPWSSHLAAFWDFRSEFVEAVEGFKLAT